MYDMTLILYSLISYCVYDILATVKHNELERQIYTYYFQQMSLESN